MIENPEQALKKGDNARKRAVELYDWNNNVEQMISIYDQVLKKQ